MDFHMKFRSALVLALFFCSPAFAQVTPGTSPLAVSNGGTGIGVPSITTVNGVPCTLNGPNCSGITASSSSVTIGTTTVTSGTPNGLFYDNAGVFGNLATLNNGVLITSGAGVPSISTTLPSGLSIGSPTLTGTVGGSGVIPSVVLANTAVSPSSYGSSTSIPSFTVNAAGQLTAAAGNVVIAPAGTLTGTTLASNVVTSSLTSVGTIVSGVWNGTAITLAGGGTNNSGLTASNGGIVWSDASKLNVLAGTVTANQCLLSGSSAAPSWGSCAGGSTVNSIAGNTGAFTLAAGVTNSTNQIQLDGNYTGFALSNCTLAASVATNILTVALKTNSGVDPSATSPCYLNYRNATAATGSTSLVAQTAALSITTNAVGATLGSFNSNTPFRFWVVVFNNSGTNVLSLINCTGTGQIFPLDESTPQTSVAMSASATSAGVFYTPNGTTVTNGAFRILGYVEYATGLTTAGTYASGPTKIQVFGPGVYKPGEAVQRVQVFSNSVSSTSSASFQPSNLAKNFTKASAANSINIVSTGTILNQSGAVTTSGSIQIFRGNAACTTALGANITTSLAAAFAAAASVAYLDIPAASGTASAQYTTCIAANGTTGVQFPNTAYGATMIFEEIQG
jgi:hypothetical protein